MRRRDGIRLWSLALAALAAFALVAVAFFLVAVSLPALRKEGWGFLFLNHWAYLKEAFGAATLYGTAAVSGIALLLAAPLGIGAALFASEVCSRPSWPP